MEALSDLETQRFALDQHSLLMMTDIKGIITFVNDKFCAVSGFSKEELLGQNHRMMKSGVHSREFFSQMWHTISDGKVWHGEICNRAKDGSLYWMESTIVPQLGSDGKPCMYIAAQTNITALKQTEESLRRSEARLRVIYNTTHDAVMTLDENGFLDCNPSTLTLFGCDTAADFISKHPAELSPEFQPCGTDSKTLADQYIAQAIKHGHHHFEWVHKSVKTGKNFDAHVRLNAVDLDGKMVLQAMVLDISARKKAETALRESESSYRRQFADNFSVMLTIDPVDGSILDANAAALKFYGYTHDQITSMRITDINILPPDQVKLLMYSVTQEHGRSFEAQHRLSDGTLRDVQVSSSRIQFGDRQVLHSIIFDITERKQMVARLQILSRAIEQCPVSVVITDTKGTIEFVNPFFTKLTGYTAEEAMGHNPSVLKTNKTPPERFTEMWTAIKSGKTWSGELFNKAKDGREFIEMASIAPVLDEKNQITHFVAVKEDITAQRHYEEELRKAKLNADRANSAKGEFLATMSHEIRTPMNGVIGMTGMLLDTELSDEQRRYAEIVRSSADSLLELLNDILDFSKIEAGKLDLEMLDFELDKVFHETATMMSDRMYKKGLAFICDIRPGTPIHLRGDPGRLRQILINLLGNAFKFTSTGEIAAQVRVISETAEDVLLRFSVRDTGIGIPAEKLSGLFQKFAQVDASTTRKFGGTGLGLAICKQLVELMGGECGVESELGKGSTFWFTTRLPRQSHPMKDATPPVELKGTRLLVVDNNATHREVLRAQVQAWGMRVDEAPDGSTALSVLAKANAAGDPFSVAVIDMRMPNMNGENLGRMLKADAQLKETHLVMMTAHDEPGQAQRMNEIGFEAYLTKPVRTSELFDCMITTVAKQAVKMPPQQPLNQLANSRSYKVWQGVVRILLAEDNPVNQMVAVSLLKKLGLRVDAVANGLEAVKTLESIPYDLVLMDMQMPEMDGLEATRLIRNPDSKVLNHNVPIVAMTANAMQSDRDHCKAAGMDDYISKPVSLQALAKMMEQWLPLESDDPDNKNDGDAKSAQAASL